MNSGSGKFGFRLTNAFRSAFSRIPLATQIAPKKTIRIIQLARINSIFQVPNRAEQAGTALIQNSLERVPQVGESQFSIVGFKFEFGESMAGNF